MGQIIELELVSLSPPTHPPLHKYRDKKKSIATAVTYSYKLLSQC